MNQLFPRKFYLLIYAILVVITADAQLQSDSMPIHPNALNPAPNLRNSQELDLTVPFKGYKLVSPFKNVEPASTGQAPDTSLQAFYKLNPYVNLNGPLITRQEKAFSAKEKDLVFYVLLGLMLLLGFIRLVFAKYFNDLFRIFFQTNFRQKSIREQLLQNKLASMMMNIFFCLSAGLFLYFVACYKGWLDETAFIQNALVCVGLVASVYTTKYIGLQIIGWLFGMAEVMETYLFIVYLINKVIGVLLLPAIIFLALGSNVLQPVLLVISLLILCVLYLYRYLIALPLVSNHSGLTGFHFFIYLCAFEVVPVLLIYKSLLLMLSR